MRGNRRAVGESSSGWVRGWMGVGGGERREGIGEDGVGEGEERETEGGREVQVDKSTSGQVDKWTSRRADERTRGDYHYQSVWRVLGPA